MKSTRFFLKRFLSAVIVSITVILSATTLSAKELPNIVLVMADDQGWGDVGYYGHTKLLTPNLDDMSRSGLRMDRFHAAAPVCSPTRGSVLTGRHPNRFECFKWGHSLRPQEVTIAEAMQKSGYTTGHFGKWHLGSVRANSPVNPGAKGFDHWLSAENFYDNDPILSDQGRAVQFNGEGSEITVDAAIEFITECKKKNQPSFTVVWFGSPHNPHKALDADRQPYLDEPKKMQHFYGEITAMDRAVGKLRKAIKSLGIRDNTLLWYCSDNGAIPGVGDNGQFRGYKGSVYEGGLLVPAIIEWPNQISETRTTNLRCNTCDIFPTLLDVIGMSPDKNWPELDGVSLLPLIKGQAIQQRPKPMGFWDFAAKGIITPSDKMLRELMVAQQSGIDEATFHPEQLRMDAGEITKQYTDADKLGHAAWLDGDWKLHRITKGKDPASVRYELYNLANDPKETTNLIQEEPAKAQEMKKTLDAWMQSVLDSMNGLDYPNADSQNDRLGDAK